MKQSDICTRVRSVVDSLVESRTDGVILITDQATMDSVIKEKIHYALMYVLTNAGSDMLGDVTKELDTSKLGDADIIRQGKVWKVCLPEDTLRVHTVRLGTWMQSPTPVDEASTVALMQTNEYARGSWDRPITVLRRVGGRIWVEMFSGRGSETKADIHVAYISVPDMTNITGSTDIAVPKRVEGAFIYYVAALTMTAFREDIAPALFSIANQQLGIVQSNVQEEQS